MTFKGVSNTLQNLMSIGAAVSEIDGGCGSTRPPSLVKGVGTKRLSKGRVKVYLGIFNSISYQKLAVFRTI